MVEISVTAELDLHDRDALFRHMKELGLEPDPELDPVPMNEQGSGAQRRPTSLIVTGTVADTAAIEALERHPEVIKVWRDTPIAPFGP
jgi:hypothetical protein